ncbi:MAG: gas vesicle protein K [Candidatus Binataceae bacterium]
MTSDVGVTALRLSPPRPQQSCKAVRPQPAPRSEQACDRRVNIDSEDLKNGLAQLVLTLIKLLHELLEKQAIRRIESGRLREHDCERIGLALMKQSEQIEKLRDAFGLSEQDLNLDLGPLGKLL